MFSRVFLLVIIGQAVAELEIISIELVGGKVVRLEHPVTKGYPTERVTRANTNLIIDITLVGKNVLLTSLGDSKLQYGKESCLHLKNDDMKATIVPQGHSCVYGGRFTWNGELFDLKFNMNDPFATADLSREILKATEEKAAAFLKKYQASNATASEEISKATEKKAAAIVKQSETEASTEHIQRPSLVNPEEQAAAILKQSETEASTKHIRRPSLVKKAGLMILILLGLGGCGYFYCISRTTNRSKRVSDESV